MSNTQDSSRKGSLDDPFVRPSTNGGGLTEKAEDPLPGAPGKKGPARPLPVEKSRRRTQALFSSAAEGTDTSRLEKAPSDDGDVVILTEDEVYEQLGFSFPTWKKW